MEQKREHFRINYPIGHNARFKAGKNSFAIIDISQKGMKFSFEGKAYEDEWDIDMTVNGHVAFLFGETVGVTGRVLRTTPVDVILFLDDPIPLKYMYDEHRYIIKNFNVDTK